jgi:hypothetical protein
MARIFFFASAIAIDNNKWSPKLHENEPLNILIFKFNFNPKVGTHEGFMV